MGTLRWKVWWLGKWINRSPRCRPRACPTFSRSQTISGWKKRANKNHAGFALSPYSRIQDGCGLIVGKRTTPACFFVLLGIIVFFLIYAGVRRRQQTPPPEPSL